jgi:hypothetical protein
MSLDLKESIETTLKTFDRSSQREATRVRRPCA